MHVHPHVHPHVGGSSRSFCQPQKLSDLESISSDIAIAPHLPKSGAGMWDAASMLQLSVLLQHGHPLPLTACVLFWHSTSQCF
jgi:hypothetical protein